MLKFGPKFDPASRSGDIAARAGERGNEPCGNHIVDDRYGGNVVRRIARGAVAAGPALAQVPARLALTGQLLKPA